MPGRRKFVLPENIGLGGRMLRLQEGCKAPIFGRQLGGDREPAIGAVMNTEGKRVLITGASGGLGAATVTALVEKGCKVIGIDKQVAGAPFGDNTIVADLTNEGEAKEAVAAAIARLGGLDVLINNAGVLDLQDPGESPPSAAREHIEVNFLAPW